MGYKISTNIEYSLFTRCRKHDIFSEVSVQSLAFNSFSERIQKVRNKSLKAILDTVNGEVFPGSQLYLYYRMHTAWEEALDPSEFITAASFIHRYRLPREERTEALLHDFFRDPVDIKNVYRIITESWTDKQAVS